MVKLFVTTCGNPGPDGWVVHHIQQIPGSVIVNTLEACDVVFYVWTWQPNYQADSALIERVVNSGKPVVVFDYLEAASESFMLSDTSDWIPALQPYAPCAALLPAIKLYFKREYCPTKLQPTPFPVAATDFVVDYFPGYDSPQTRAEFDQRPIDIFYYWGYSSLDRPHFHAELMKFYHHPFLMCFTLEEIDYCLKSNWNKGIKAFMFTPPARRYPLETVLKYQNMAKLSISLRGSGWKCFRHAEAPYNAVMATQAHPVEFQYPWQDGVNCIHLPNLPRLAPDRHWLDYTAALSRLSTALKEDLYPIYLAGMENAKRYVAARYIQSHWIPTMRKHGVWP